MMKKKIVWLLALMMAVSLMLMACGGSEEAGTEEESAEADPEPGDEEGQESGEEAEAGSAALATGEWSNDSGDFILSLVGAETFTNDDGAESIRIYYDFTNNTSYTTCMANELYDTFIQQDDTDLDYAYTSDPVPEYDNRGRHIRPGVTLRCVDECTLISDSSVSLTIYASNEDEQIIDHEFDLAALPGRPAEDLEVQPVTDPVWMEGWPTEGTYDTDYYVSILSTEFVEGAGGEKLIRIFYEYTNNSAEAERFSYAVYDARAFQDGIRLKEGTTDSSVKVPEEGDYWSKDVAPGETATVAISYELISDSPIEVEVYDPWADGGMGLVVEVE